MWAAEALRAAPRPSRRALDVATLARGVGVLAGRAGATLRRAAWVSPRWRISRAGGWRWRPTFFRPVAHPRSRASPTRSATQPVHVQLRVQAAPRRQPARASAAASGTSYDRAPMTTTSDDVLIRPMRDEDVPVVERLSSHTFLELDLRTVPRPGPSPPAVRRDVPRSGSSGPGSAGQHRRRRLLGRRALRRTAARRSSATRRRWPGS